MISDSFPKATTAVASTNHKDCAKKKRVNRSAKLKQCKLDARREQWLSQVKFKDECKEDVNGKTGRQGGSTVQLENVVSQPIRILEVKPGVEEEEFGDGSSMHHFSDCDSSSSISPTSRTSCLLGSSDSGVDFTASSSRTTSSSSNGCFSGSMSEEDEENVDDDDGCLDDWEAMADFLDATDVKNKEHMHMFGCASPFPEEHGNSTQSDSQLGLTNQSFSRVDVSCAKPECGGITMERPSMNFRAWTSDDAFRPQSLPNLSNQYSFLLNSERHICRGVSAWDSKKVVPVPTICPICYEDLDGTDSSFCPCSCGFMLCLFCHKRILEDDGRCPGCRNHYVFNAVAEEETQDGASMAYPLARSCSTIIRS